MVWLICLASSRCGRIAFEPISSDEQTVPFCAGKEDATLYSTYGVGTLSDPFAICTAAQFVNIGNNPEGWDRHYRLMADIDLAAFDISSYTPIGSLNTPFSGTLDGAGHTIRNFSYVDPQSDYIGLFGFVGGAASKIWRLGVIDIDVAGRNHVGGIAGRVRWGSIIHSYATGAVAGNSNVGGVAGSAQSAVTISSSYSTATVQGDNDWIGGLVGNANGVRITSSYASGDVSGGWRGVGGLVGTYSFGSAIQVYATGNVNGTNVGVGGLFGTSGSCFVRDAFATGNVTCAGSNDNCGLITGDRNTNALPTFTNVFFDSSSTCTNGGDGACNTGDGTGIDLMQQPDYFFDTANEPLASWEENWSHPISWQSTGSYPQPNPVFLDPVMWGTCTDHQNDAPFAGGLGTTENPYLICTPAQLQEIGASVNHWDQKSFLLMDNIDMAAYGTTLPPYNVIGTGTTGFQGALYGNGKVIRNLRYIGASDDHIGLFGVISYSLVKRIGLENVDMTGRDFVGAIGGLVTRISFVAMYSTGSIVGRDHVGGLVGRQHGWLGHSYSTANVQGRAFVGALTGEAGCQYCFTTGNVRGELGQTNIGPVHGFGGTASEVFYDSNAILENYDNTLGTAKDIGGVDPADYFFKHTNEPFTNWDFSNTWQPNATAPPLLR